VLCARYALFQAPPHLCVIWVIALQLIQRGLGITNRVQQFHAFAPSKRHRPLQGHTAVCFGIGHTQQKLNAFHMPSVHSARQRHTAGGLRGGPWGQQLDTGNTSKVGSYTQRKTVVCLRIGNRQKSGYLLGVPGFGGLAQQTGVKLYRHKGLGGNG